MLRSSSVLYIASRDLMPRFRASLSLFRRQRTDRSRLFLIQSVRTGLLQYHQATAPLYEGKKRSDFQSREEWIAFCREKSRDARIREIEKKLDEIRKSEDEVNAKIADVVQQKDKAFRRDHKDMKKSELEKEIQKIHRSVRDEYSATEAELGKRYQDFRAELEAMESKQYTPVTDWIGHLTEKTRATGNAKLALEMHLPLEERSDYGAVVIGRNKQVTAELEFDYYVFVGDQLKRTN